MCKVSIIVPMFNTENYIRSCLDSLAVQTLSDIEIIVVDDGSIDDGLTIAHEFANKYPYFKVFSIQNQGVSHARNYGVSISSGDYIAFVDSDDTVEPDYCRLMYEKAIRDGNDLVICRYDRVTLSEGKVKHVPVQNSMFEDDNYTMAERRNMLPRIGVGPWDKLLKRSLIEKLQFPEGVRYAEDQLFSVKAFCYAQSIGTINQVLYHYHYEIHGGVTTNFGRERLDWVRIMNNISEFIKNEDEGRTMRDELEYFMILKSIRLCSAAIVRKSANLELRIQLVSSIHSFFEKEYPRWRLNPYFIEDRIQRLRHLHSTNYNYHNGKKIRHYYNDAGKIHSLFLIFLSRITPEVFYGSVLEFDHFLFFIFHRIRWRLFQRI